MGLNPFSKKAPKSASNSPSTSDLSEKHRETRADSNTNTLVYNSPSGDEANVEDGRPSYTGTHRTDVQPVTNNHMRSYLGLTGRKLNLVISIVATNGFLLFGYDQGVMSGIITDPVFNNYFPQTLNDSTVQGITTGIYELGCLAGAIFVLIFGERIGRRRSVIMGGWVMIIGVVIQISSVSGHHPYLQFMIGRTITGVGNGMNTSSIPTYQAECSHSNNRGLLICIEGATIAFGTMIGTCLPRFTIYQRANLDCSLLDQLWSENL